MEEAKGTPATAPEVISDRMRRRRDERGFVLVWGAILLTGLFAISAFAIDLGNWYIHIQRAQRAADSAALAGDPFLPGDVAQAIDTARITLTKNGVSAADAAAADIHQVPTSPNALSVTVRTTAVNGFITIVGGSKTTTFTRTAVAIHTPGLQMGNGSNLLGGHEPLEVGASPWGVPTSWDGDYWIGIEGSAAPKVDGDRYMSNRCNDTPLYGPGYAPNGVDFCNGNNNQEFDARGYAFHVHVRRVPGGGTRNLIIEGFDPGFADAGATTCTGPKSVGVNMPDPGFCATDADGHYATIPSGNQDTYYSLYGSVNSTTPIATCSTYPGTQDAASAVASDPFAASWIHHWVQVCPAIAVDLSKDNDFVLRIRSQGGAGVNGFLLRSGLSTTPDRSGLDVNLSRSYVALTADTSIAVYNQYGAGSTRFPVMQVDRQFAGQSIEIEFFDIGDARDPATGNYVTATISLVSSDSGAIVPGTCEWTPPPSSGFINAPGCVATTSPNGRMQGQLAIFKWNVPSNYNCVPTGYTRNDGCWVSVRMGFPAADVHDFTTWSLRKPPSPLHLNQ